MLQLHAAEHVVADRGMLLVSPIDTDESTGTAYVGFTGRCLTCPNAEGISFRQAKRSLQEPEPQVVELIRSYFPELRKSFKEVTLKLYPEWEHWRI